MKHFIVYFIASVLLIGCVPQKKFQEIESAYKKCQEENDAFKSQLQSLEASLEQAQQSNKDLTSQLAQLETEKKELQAMYDQTKMSYDKLSVSYDLLSDNKDKLLAENANETKQLIEKLEATQRSLQGKEDTLKTLESALNDRESRLNNLNSELAAREKRVKELEDMLARKDSAVAAIKKRVQDALLGFENNGLTIEQRNGKVYVSLEESLLFALGKYEVDVKGVEVLKKLATVLELNPDINIMVEGHTDNVPYRGSGDLKDNWDLSVKRATSVLKIITENSKVDPTRLTAAGRGEYIPLDNSNTKEGKQKNRRTEIILTPKLDELYEFLNESN